MLIDKSDSLSKNQYYQYYKLGVKRGGIFYGTIFFIIGVLVGAISLFIIGLYYA